MTTIPRNRKARIATLKATLTKCRAYTLGNYFADADIDPAFAWEQLAKFDFAKLRDNGDGTYTIRMHSNCWYELTAP